uniref:Uncharacterized protein n=1 Tax=Mucochytrium quahogii TaxID=96639 RepID=A0A7S2WMJ7_9STRA|mmetsp:Transcript_37932/g.61700  ORF Transcript_37932/g.61700 Transcript_37932/m.61700 type:complete len:145 (-) Transcript_37932:8-442(-)
MLSKLTLAFTLAVMGVISCQADPQGSGVCVHNGGGYSMRFQLQLQNDDGSWSILEGWTGYYPAGQTKCVDLKNTSLSLGSDELREALEELSDGRIIRIEQDIFWGATNYIKPYITYNSSLEKTKFYCSGTTYHSKCKCKKNCDF